MSQPVWCVLAEEVECSPASITGTSWVQGTLEVWKEYGTVVPVVVLRLVCTSKKAAARPWSTLNGLLTLSPSIAAGCIAALHVQQHVSDTAAARSRRIPAQECCDWDAGLHNKSSMQYVALP